MDIPDYIANAVQSSSESSPPKRTKPIGAASAQSQNNERFTHQYLTHPIPTFDDHSSVSDIDPEYETDFTTPDSSDMPDDVEEFRDKEYPQLKGKVYLDHGGTTVCIPGVMPKTLY